MTSYLNIKKHEYQKNNNKEKLDTMIISNSAITLISLIITIIIMLILASVSIDLTLGDNGIFTKAREAKEKMEIAIIKEQIQMDILNEKLGNNGKIYEDKIKDILEKYGDLSEEENLEDKTLTTNEGHDIKVSDIYDGEIIVRSAIFETKIELSSTTAYANQTIVATVYQKELKKGIKLEECKWVLNNNENYIGTDAEELYTEGPFTEEIETLNLTVAAPGTYFLHILSKNIEGEKVETKSEAITFNETIGKTFEYTGTIESYKIPISGLYQLQVYGASGGQANSKTLNKSFSGGGGRFYSII